MPPKKHRKPKLPSLYEAAVITAIYDDKNPRNKTIYAKKAMTNLFIGFMPASNCETRCGAKALLQS